jgi:hypothetical protein
MFSFLHFSAKNCSNLMQVFNVFTWKCFNTLLKHVVWFGMNPIGIEYSKYLQKIECNIVLDHFFSDLSQFTIWLFLKYSKMKICLNHNVG